MSALLILAACLGDPAIEWETSPEAAAERARKEGKLVLVLHLSGLLGQDDRT